MAVYNDLNRILKRESNGSVTVNVPNLGEYILPNKVNKDKLFKSILPIYVEVNRGAVHIGSRDLPIILVADFSGMKVLYTTENASSIYDYYMTVLNVNLIKPVVNIRSNADHINYRKNDINNYLNNKKSFSEKVKYIFTLKFLFKSNKKNKNSSTENNIKKTTWTGLPRYQNNYKGNDNKDEKSEYARVSTLITADELILSMYTDVPGPVPPLNSEYFEESQKNLPEWRIDIKLFSSQINYGPWTDRNRTLLQYFFYPLSFRDMEIVRPPISGQLRVAPAMKLFIVFEEKTTFRVPTKEPSKDNLWRNKNENDIKKTKKDKSNEQSVRPYAWLNVNFNEGSHIYYELPSFILEDGYEGKLDVNLINVQVTTSIDYATFLHGSQLKINATIPAPLEWNKKRTMPFDIQLLETKIYLINDHIQLITDLIADWSDMEPIENEYFVPTIYDINITFKEFSILLCINECNIIDQLNDLEQNSYLILSGDILDVNVNLPFTVFNPIYTCIPFKVSSKNSPLTLGISLPKSHTIGANINKESTIAGTIKNFELEGDYSFHSVYNPEYIDSMNLNIMASDISFKIFGYLIKYFMFIADNYFGSYGSFTTVSEYREKLNSKHHENNINTNPINAFDMNILIQGENIEAYLPESLYTYKDYITVKTKLLEVEIRGTDQFQDIQINTNPVMIFNKNCSNDFLYIDDLAIYGHRMFGPMPYKLVYGSDWRFNIGSVIGEVHPSYIISIYNFLETFLYHFDDFDNSILEIPVLNDFMSLQLMIKKIDLSIWGKGSTTIVYLKNGFNLQLDNTINVHYCNRIFLDFPYIGIYLLTLADNNKEVESSFPWTEVASIDTNISLCIYLKSSNWKEFYDKQTSYIRQQDRLTKRMTFIYENIENDNYDGSNVDENEKIFGYVPVLVPPFRVTKQGYKETNSNKQNFELLPIFIQIPISDSISASLNSYENKNENESNEYYEFRLKYL
ncbi:hypothetical protein BCR32DRAFT_266435 [Anaeromyces robustus]|uniref:Csf1 N-terminal domain-containing protein n=1 Tax=Anaeromyces robustus TaxID=1754192 RepID=A0A1Y1XEM7_9FUNG|nr:hypothetical protein BCR32DRAFT_266435 [Anaeromyces robustus]|eukprot:ORX84220.1 hypothetical protein BCR32DRAFT_266435 [Anaeromyces robustus]